MSKVNAETPIAFIRSLVAAYEKRGMDFTEALGAAQIAPSLLDDDKTRVTSRQMEVLSAIAMRELDDETPGWFSRRLPWGSHGMICRASLPSSNLEVALKRWCRHYRILLDEIELDLSVKDGVAHLHVYEHTDLGQFRELCLVTIMRNIHAFACWAIDSHIPVEHAMLPYAPPSHKAVYSHIFCPKVSFEAPHAAFSFNQEYLKLPIRRDDRDLRDMLQRPFPLIVLRYKRDRLVSARIRNHVRNHSGIQWNADAIAGALSLSKRSLFRYLEAEGLTLQQLKNEVRKDLAIQQISTTNKPLKLVAASIGFASESSFVRAFQQWTGKTPGDYRIKVRLARIKSQL